MLTLLDAISLAGSRAKQNDDAWGLTFNRAFVIDGATDLHDAPISGYRSDASWLARAITQALHTAETVLNASDLLSLVSNAVASKWNEFQGAAIATDWMQPLAAGLIVTETKDGLEVLDVGDCRIFVSPSQDTVRISDGTARAAESVRAAKMDVQAKECLDLTDSDRMNYLRNSRSRANHEAAALGLRPPAPEFIRRNFLRLTKPTLCLIATDGFSSLVDVYGTYTTDTLVTAALEKGLSTLADELRTIEANDPLGKSFARWKTSDDATAVLFRYE